MAEPGDRAPRNPDIAYEHSDWHIGAVGLTLLGLLVFLVIAPLTMMLVYPRALSDVSRQLTARPPAPRLQIDPAQDLAAFEAEQQKRLHSYYWIDKGKGIVHIPIEQAMQRLVQQGIDGFPKAAR